MRRALSIAILCGACGADPPPSARLKLELRFPSSGVTSNLVTYNVVARGPFTTQCDTWAFMGAGEHESAFRGTLGPDVTIDLEGLDTAPIVRACGSSQPLDLSAAGEVAVPIYLGAANAVEAVEPALDRPRDGHRLATLGDGRVLLAGGTSSASASLLIDPAAGTTEAIAGANAERGHTVTPLADGGALVIGGVSSQSGVLAETWRFDLDSNAFVPLSFDAGGGRRDHTATPLCTRAQPSCPLAGKVLVVGGFDATGAPSDEAWILDPIGGEATPLSYPMAVAQHAAVELENGDVLIAGGVDAANVPLDQAAIFVPSQSMFRGLEPIGSADPTLSVARRSFAAVLAHTGSALIVGGQSELGPTALIEAFDPQQDGFVPLPPSGGSSLGRVDPIAIPLRDDRILVAGGGQREVALVTVGADNVLLTPAEEGHAGTDGVAAALLLDGSVLLSGGVGTMEQSIFRPCPRTPTQCR